jgi:hypothetical protein
MVAHLNAGSGELKELTENDFSISHAIVASFSVKWAVGVSLVVFDQSLPRS